MVFALQVVIKLKLSLDQFYQGRVQNKFGQVEKNSFWHSKCNE